MNSPAPLPSHSHALARAADRVGATASLLCAAHCAALPFLLAVLPTLGLGWLADHLFERIFIAVASAFALTVLIRGYRMHRNPRPLTWLVPGLFLLWVGGYLVDGHDTIGLHALLVSIGGTCLALAHVVNLRCAAASDAAACGDANCCIDPAIV